MKKQIFLFLLVISVLVLGNISKIKADQPKVENTRDMASCGPNCFCCLNNTYTSCGAASCSN